MTVDQIIKVGALCSAIIGIYVFISKVVLWVDNQKKQDKRINDLEIKHDKDIADLKEELQLLTYSNLVILKSMQPNAEITEAINKIEKHINEKAHK